MPASSLFVLQTHTSLLPKLPRAGITDSSSVQENKAAVDLERGFQRRRYWAGKLPSLTSVTTQHRAQLAGL